MFRTKTAMVSESEALPGRTDQTMPVPDTHYVNGHPLQGPWPDGFQTAVFGLGCFWGAEKLFWETPGVDSTVAGYAGGYTPNPTYEEVCSGRTGHSEVVLVVFDPTVVTYEQLLEEFWEDHDRRRACARATTSARSTAACSAPPTTTSRPSPSARR
jgi:peptide-methionine (S)-S-oxide reductase